MIKLHPIGGYSEIGRNMIGIQWNDEFVILDCGLMMEKVVAYNGEENAVHLPVEQLYKYGIVADDRAFFQKHGKKVKAILVTHAHLDHSGSIPKLAPKYNAPVIGTPFTIAVIEKIFKDAKIKPCKLIQMNAGGIYKISKNLTAEFINVTHSTPQTVIIVIHTPDGSIMYANDWKFDDYPVLGERTNYERLRELGDKGLFALISDTTRIEQEGKVFSERIVSQMLKDVFFSDRHDGLVIVTTFASHIARIKTISELSKDMNRIPIILGRSMAQYIDAAGSVNIVNLRKKAQVIAKKNDIMRVVKTINKNKEKYLIICTGNQGEPDSVLSRIVDGVIPIKLDASDMAIFCSSIIPTPINVAQRMEIEDKLKKLNVRIFRDVHVSGHAGYEDHRKMITLTRPKHYIPTHGDMKKLALAIELSSKFGYDLYKNAHILKNGQVIDLL